MRYLGNKSSLVHDIYGVLNEKGLAYGKLKLFDAFCGTGSVAASLKSMYNIIINDNLLWCTQYVEGRLCGASVSFNNLGFDPFEYFERDEIVKGFFFNTYSPGGSERMYFTADNAGKIDWIRQTIQEWRDSKKVDHKEYCYLFYCLVESVSKVSNTTGVYGAFLKHWDARAQKKMSFLRVQDNNDHTNSVKVYNGKVEEIIQNVECDILYLDPPYTQNQYGTQYHLLETLARYDAPEVSKVTGSRSTSPMRSDWSKDNESHVLFEKVIATTQAKHIVFSYSKDGFLKKDYIEAVLKRYGYPETFTCKKIGYKKYRNFKNRSSDGHFEYLFYIHKKPENLVVHESPLNYTGSKFRMISLIRNNMPNQVNTFYDLFGGGFNVGVNLINDQVNKVVYNDINCYVSGMIESFCNDHPLSALKAILKYVKKFQLQPKDKDSYYAIREYYNSQPAKLKKPLLLFTMIMYGFQQQIRFNNSHGFNNPVGMRWFNNKVKEKTVSFSRKLSTLNCQISCKDYLEFENEIQQGDFVYLDPPYRLTTGAYNDGKRGFSGWGYEQEKDLFSFLDRLNKRSIEFMLSYVAQHNGVKNDQLETWLSINNYRCIKVDVQFANSKKRNEILITNYWPTLSDTKKTSNIVANNKPPKPEGTGSINLFVQSRYY